MSLGLLIIILSICILMQGFFSGSEMAVVNADKHRLAATTNKRSKISGSALYLIHHPAVFFSTTIVGVNICTITGSVVTTFYIISCYGKEYAPFAILIWPFTLVLGEMVPKSIYQYYAKYLVFVVSPILVFFSWVFFPVVWPLAKLTDFLLGGMKKKPGMRQSLTREDFEIMVAEDELALGDVKPMEKLMISSLFDLEDKKVENIMTPLIDIVSISVDSTRGDAESTLEESGYSRVPVYKGKAFNIVGVLNGVDLLFSDEPTPVNDLVKPVYYVPENMPLDSLLISMKRKGQPLAVVVDEFGGATGVVTTEDLLEEVVGEIRDEHDLSDPIYHRIGYNRYLVNARMEIKYANDRLKFDIPPGEYETLAGFLLKNVEHIPNVGECLIIGEYKYTIRKATSRMILEVEVSKIIPGSEKI